MVVGNPVGNRGSRATPVSGEPPDTTGQPAVASGGNRLSARGFQKDNGCYVREYPPSACEENEIEKRLNRFLRKTIMGHREIFTYRIYSRDDRDIGADGGTADIAGFASAQERGRCPNRAASV